MACHSVNTVTKACWWSGLQLCWKLSVHADAKVCLLSMFTKLVRNCAGRAEHRKQACC